jgi:hypothetical protein
MASPTFASPGNKEHTASLHKTSLIIVAPGKWNIRPALPFLRQIKKKHMASPIFVAPGKKK